MKSDYMPCIISWLWIYCKMQEVFFPTVALGHLILGVLHVQHLEVTVEVCGCVNKTELH